MEHQEIPVSVFIFYDSLEILDQVRELAGSCYHEIYSFDFESDEEILVRQLTQKVHHGILSIYAFEHPANALKLRQRLVKHPSLKKLRTIAGTTLLVCDKQQRKSAYLMCENRQFYTYETIRPLYDTFKFQLTLRQLKEQIETMVQLKEESQHADEVDEELSASDKKLEAIESQIEREKYRQDLVLSKVVSPLGKILENIPAEEWKKMLGSVIDAHGNASGMDIATLKENLHSLQSLHEEFFSEISFAIHDVRPEDKKIHAVPLILAADDQPVMLKIISTILEPRGYRVETAGNGAEALLKAKVMFPQVILLDIDMPVMDGFKTLKAIQELPELKSVPVIMLTSFQDKAVFEKCIVNGAKDYIVKPTKGDILVKKIEKVMLV